jgi:enoyl-CoA hydratase/carnithine racemase
MTTHTNNGHGTAVSIEHSPNLVLARITHAPVNPLSPPVVDGLAAAADATVESGAAALVIVSGIDGFFVAGADIKHMESLDPTGFTVYGERMREVFARLDGLEALTIAAIDGLALGGGLELALACKLRVGTPAARLGVPEIKLGLIPGAGGTQRLPRVVGRSRALDMLVTGRQVPGEEAFAIGLLDRLVEAGSAQTVAVEIAERVARFSRPALRATDRCLDAAFTMELDAGIAFEADEEQKLFEDGEATEGIAAFVARRAPVFASVASAAPEA